MALHLRDDQYISLTPTDSPVEDAEMDSGEVPLGQAEQEGSLHVGRGLTRMPAVTPLTPGSKGVNFQQFCDRLRTDLPGDSTKRGSFDTRTRFVVGDPCARFNAAAPLEYEVTGEIGHPHWDLIFEHILRQCGYLVEFQTVYVMVDDRDLANHQRRDSSLPHWPACGKMVAQSPQAHWTSQGENGIIAFPQLRIYGIASGAPHLGWHLCAGCPGSHVSWYQLRLAG